MRNEKVEKDRRLKELLFKIHEDVSSLERMLRDYVFRNTKNSQHPIIVKRNREEFHSLFRSVSGKVAGDIISILECFSPKVVSDDTILMNLLDANAPVNDSWFKYQFIVMKKVLDRYIKKINAWMEPEYEDEAFYEGNPYLEGESTFLMELSYVDITIFLPFPYNSDVYGT